MALSIRDFLQSPAPVSGGGFGVPLKKYSILQSPQKQFSSLGMHPPAPATPPPVVPPAAPVVSPPPPPAPVTPPRPLASAPLFPAPTGATGATGGAQIPSQYLKPDGSIKTPDEVAADIGGTLKAAHGNGDVGTIALDQFGGGNKSAPQLEAEARRIGNARNDIAVGEKDPYKVASDSGIAYTPEELSAIEKAYSGIYDPALDTALAKVTEKQTTDKAAAAAKLQSEAPFTLGKGDVRYDGKGNVIATGSGSTPATYVLGQDPTVDAYVTGFKNGTYKASDIPDAYKSIVAQGIAAGQGPNAPLSKTSTDALGIIHSLQSSKGLDSLSGQGFIGGALHPTSLFPGTDVQNTQNLAKQLQATLSLANRTQLKGQGAISDFEFRVLGEAASALGLDEGGRTNLSEADFKDQLGKLELKLQVGPTSLTDDEIQYLASPAGGGHSAEDIRKFSAQQSFNGVGNTKDSTLATGKGNIPQRNNNPGNVKAGGLADSLAVGKDEYGHLIFPDAETGFKALTADVTAKIAGSGKSPKNPTIAELGKVYAEDPNWPVKVAAILGVPIETHTGAVPIEKLVQAIAKQEGFYA